MKGIVSKDYEASWRKALELHFSDVAPERPGRAHWGINNNRQSGTNPLKLGTVKA
jgi:hypothetical protein